MKRYKELVRAAGRRELEPFVNEQTLDTTKSLAIKAGGVSRRDFMRIARTYGLTSTYLALGAMGGMVTAEALAKEVTTTYKRRMKKPAKFTLRLGTIYNDNHVMIQRAGAYDFARDLEERTDGEIRINMLNAGSVCAEERCIQQAMQGVLDIGTSSTQNASGAAPWLNALDFPYMFQSAGQIYHFLYNPESEALFRKVYREKHKMEFLFSLCELRNLFMGAKWKDKPPITSVKQLAGTKNRVTNTQLGRIAMQLMGLNPVPVAWVETLDAMKSGLIDGMETWSTATTAFNITPVVSQYVGLKFIPGTGHTAMRSQTFDKLGSALQEQVLESAYLTQVTVQYNNEAGLVQVSGEVPNPPKDTLFGKYGVKMNFLTPAALKEAEEIASPKKPEYNTWHERLNKMAGFNVYEKMLPVARQFPADKLAIDVEPRRWWRKG
ncbi:MAG: TRAP transporter substrate-binding protein DctP [Hyphomicrobiaceae bacterium]